MLQMRLTAAFSDIPRVAAASTGSDDCFSFNNASSRSSMLMSHSSKSSLRSAGARSFPAAAPAAGSGTPHLFAMDSKRFLAISGLLWVRSGGPIRVGLRRLILGPTLTAASHPTTTAPCCETPDAEEHHQEAEEEENDGKNAPQPGKRISTATPHSSAPPFFGSRGLRIGLSADSQPFIIVRRDEWKKRYAERTPSAFSGFSPCIVCRPGSTCLAR